MVEDAVNWRDPVKCDDETCKEADKRDGGLYRVRTVLFKLKTISEGESNIITKAVESGIPEHALLFRVEDLEYGEDKGGRIASSNKEVKVIIGVTF